MGDSLEALTQSKMENNKEIKWITEMMMKIRQKETDNMDNWNF